MIRSVRGATTVEKNDKDEILTATKELLETIIKENEISKEDIVNITFTMTDDLNKVYPAVGARELGFTDVPLVCFQELNVEGSLRMCVRIMVTYNTDKKLSDIKHVYLREAVRLRPDLVK